MQAYAYVHAHIQIHLYIYKSGRGMVQWQIVGLIIVSVGVRASPLPPSLLTQREAAFYHSVTTSRMSNSTCRISESKPSAEQVLRKFFYVCIYVGDEDQVDSFW